MERTLSEALPGKGWGLFRNCGQWKFRDPQGRIIASGSTMEETLRMAIRKRMLQ